MANIFISYGDHRFKESVSRIKKQSKSLGIFDKIRIYTPKDLPLYIKSSPLFAFSKGGGYWLWKPYIICRTLNMCKNGDVIYYVDAGCRLNRNSLEWKQYDELIKKYDYIFFQYRSDVDYNWGKHCSSSKNNSAHIKHWIKPIAMDYFIKYFGDSSFSEYNKIWGGMMILKKTSNNIILDEWLKISIFHPELIVDPFGEELSRIPESFNLHRHDQSILTPLVYHYRNSQNILILPETSESQKETAAVIAERYRVGKLSLILYLKYHLYHLFHGRE